MDTIVIKNSEEFLLESMFESEIMQLVIDCAKKRESSGQELFSYQKKILDEYREYCKGKLNIELIHNVVRT